MDHHTSDMMRASVTSKIVFPDKAFGTNFTDKTMSLLCMDLGMSNHVSLFAKSFATNGTHKA